ncbi:MAG: type II toxin-antitoxin system RelE/ParE family toxin [Chitinophagales bacterium]|nr:type II toxin-antitoxin system RelE/ParE family toxin [Hyphomicrobiales bacterium]
MKLIFLPEAEAEIDEAVVSLDAASPKLGDDFYREVDAIIERILSFPHIGKPLGKTIRQCVLKRFPYLLIYRIKADELTIVAVAHAHRRSGYWRGRM